MKSKLKLSTKLSNGKTQLAEYFATPPFKVMTLPNHSGIWQQGLNAMQMSSSPGVLAGDLLEIQISLAKSTALSLNTQAFTRVQAMNEKESAEQITHIHLAEYSRLFYLPHPLVLHKDSAFKQKTTIEMQPNSELIYGEIIAIGRVLNGERFAFRQFSSHLNIYALQHNGKKYPLLSDCIQWHPALMRLTALSQMENYTHQGALIYLNRGKSAVELKGILQRIHAHLAEEKSMLVGASLLNSEGIIIRVLGYRAEPIQALFHQIANRFQNEMK
ncbi:urease accessory protein UreD [Rodentibacter trehalosifermentans]|uniref:Urease accessory protein UreD n=1 Tax=Rodentibacter trehalosifermentans TaxID=1908263 RepID=A0A1V3ITH6_9PAST|nr:urease accessory protein UreD [Rodentibacter trehalosifermentans]OOF45572.1 urease accessory protein [Rodentibacter trehalosifermentans]OOF46073.1 urease accessory protein [Rodentibacter trehalosifermentans]OOF53076.1 urease accessory protein [Rodentibacter trehalosifermentans]